MHPVMSAGQIITGKKMVIPLYPPGSYVYAVYGNHTNSIDNMRTHDVLYLCPNKEGGGHFVYNVNTNKKNSTCRVIGSNKKPIPMSNIIIDLINLRASKEEETPEGTVCQNMDGHTTVDNYNDDDSEPDEDDKSYETSDDSTIEGDHEAIDEQIQGEEDQKQYFNIPHIMEVNEDN